MRRNSRQLLDVEQQGRRHVVEHFHEHQAGAGDVAGQGQRQGDTAEQAQAVRAQVLGGFLHAAVDVAQSCREIDQDERKIVDGLQEDDAVQPFHEADLEIEPLVEQQVHRTVAAEQELHRHRADEGRHDQRQEAQRLHQHGAAELEACREIGERQRQHRRPHDRHRRHVDRVPERAHEEVGAPEVEEIDEGESTAALFGEGDVDHRYDGYDQEDAEEQRNGQRERGLPGGTHSREDHQCLPVFNGRTVKFQSTVSSRARRGTIPQVGQRSLASLGMTVFI